MKKNNLYKPIMTICCIVLALCTFTKAEERQSSDVAERSHKFTSLKQTDLWPSAKVGEQHWTTRGASFVGKTAISAWYGFARTVQFLAKSTAMTAYHYPEITLLSLAGISLPFAAASDTSNLSGGSWHGMWCCADLEKVDKGYPMCSNPRDTFSWQYAQAPACSPNSSVVLSQGYPTLIDARAHCGMPIPNVVDPCGNSCVQQGTCYSVPCNNVSYYQTLVGYAFVPAYPQDGYPTITENDPRVD